MKLKQLVQFMVLGSALTITAVGCKTHPEGVTHIPGERPPLRDPNPGGAMPFNPGGQGIVENPGGPGGGIPPTAPGNYAGYGDDRQSLKGQTVYFEFDKSSIKTSEQAKLNEVANYLKANPNVGLRVEGNCDERGTEEYNRSLGDKRASAAREYLANLGIDPQKILTLSNGEDKPAVPGHNEAAWSKNRRDEFIVLTPPRP